MKGDSVTGPRGEKGTQGPPGKAKFHKTWGPSACTRKHCIFGLLELIFIWGCFVFCLLFPLSYVVCALVPAEGTKTYVLGQIKIKGSRRNWGGGGTIFPLPWKQLLE